MEDEQIMQMEDERGSISNVDFEDATDFGWGDEAETPEAGDLQTERTPMKTQSSLAVPDQMKKITSMSSEDSWGDGGEEEVDDAWGGAFSVPDMNKNQSDWGELDGTEDDIAGIGNNTDAPRVRPHIARRAHADAKELNFLTEIAGAHTKVEADDVACTIAIAIKVSGLNLTQLQREIYALDSEEQILVKIKFDTYYLGGARPTVIDVGKIPATAAVSYDSNPEEFLFTWTLKDRLQNTFIKGRGWPDDSLGERPPACVGDLMEMTQRPIADILTMLKKHENNQGAVVSSLFQENCIVPKVSKKEAVSTLINWLENVSGQKLTDLPICGNEIDLFYIMQHNYLAQLVLYSAYVIMYGNRTCMICDGNLDYIAWKPSVCKTEKCQFQFNSLGLGFSLSHQIRNERIIMDLYITMLVTCVQTMGDRVKMCFPDEVSAWGCEEKYQNYMKWVTKAEAEKLKKQKNRGRRYYNAAPPQLAGEVVEPPENKEGLVQTPDVAKLAHVVGIIPSIKEMIAKLDESKILTTEFNQDRLTEDQYLKASLNQRNPLLHPLLKWLCTSNHAYLRLLRPDERFSEIDTEYQFVFANASPDKEMQFQQLKKRCAKYRAPKGLPSTIQAWHGSGFGNWHSIMRVGLQNLSNTKWMSCGAAFGAGIYLSPNFQTSLGYAKQSGTWKNSELGHMPVAMALCELINDPELPKPKPHYVIQKEEWVMTRFFFIFPQGTRRNTKVKLPLKVPEKLQHLFDTLQ